MKLPNYSTVSPRVPKNEYNFNSAVLFNGNSYGMTSGLSGVSIPNDFSFVYWFRNTSLKRAANEVILRSTTSGANLTNLFQIYIQESSGLRIIKVDCYNGSNLVVWQNAAVNYPEDYKVHCLAITFSISGSNSVIKTYLDGALKSTSSGGSNYRTNFQNIYISYATPLFLNAPLVGDLRLINSLLSDDAINQHWNKGKGNSNLDLLSHFIWYKFESNLSDSSGNARNLTATGTPTYNLF